MPSVEATCRVVVITAIDPTFIAIPVFGGSIINNVLLGNKQAWRKMNKLQQEIKYFHDLEEIVTDPLLIDSGKMEFENMWSISINSELADTITVEDLSIFFEKVISNRKAQAKTLNLATNLLFYLWFDEQASQLRFIIIPDDGNGLPNCGAFFYNVIPYCKQAAVMIFA